MSAYESKMAQHTHPKSLSVQPQILSVQSSREIPTCPKKEIQQMPAPRCQHRDAVVSLQRLEGSLYRNAPCSEGDRSLKEWESRQSQQINRRYSEEPKGNFRTKKVQ